MQETQPNQSPDQEVQNVDLGKMEEQASAEVRMLMQATKDMAYMGKIPNMPQVTEMISSLSDADQEALAQAYFDKSVGERGNLEVYLKFKGSAFANKFKELEDTRLKAAGYGGLTI